MGRKKRICEPLRKGGIEPSRRVFACEVNWTKRLSIETKPSARRVDTKVERLRFKGSWKNYPENTPSWHRL